MTNPKLEVVAETVFDCSFLDGGVETALYPLPNQNRIAYQGVTTRGSFDRDLGFLDRVPEAERHAVYAYLNSHDVQQQPVPRARRVIIDVFDALCQAGLSDAEACLQESWLKAHVPFLYTELYSTVRKVRAALPQSMSNVPHKERWWLFGSVRRGLRCAWAGLTTVVVIGVVGKVFRPGVVSIRDPQLNRAIRPTHRLCIVPTDSRAVVGLLNTVLFEVTPRRFCSSLGTGLNFSPTDVFPYFPFPWKGRPTGNEYISPVLNPPPDVEERLGPPASVLLKLREEILTQPMKHGLGTAAFSGPTALYNAFDDPCDERPAIQALREAHMALEAAVLAEYGWGDLAEKPWVFDRPWIDGSWRFVPNAETRREYLRRLEWLNHEQAARAPISTPSVI